MRTRWPRTRTQHGRKRRQVWNVSVDVAHALAEKDNTGRREAAIKGYVSALVRADAIGGQLRDIAHLIRVERRRMAVFPWIDGAPQNEEAHSESEELRYLLAVDVKLKEEHELWSLLAETARARALAHGAAVGDCEMTYLRGEVRADAELLSFHQR